MSPFDPRQLKTALSRAYYAYNGAVRGSVQPKIMGWVRFEVFDGIEALAAAQPGSRIAALHQHLMQLLADGTALMNSEELRNDFKRVYQEADQIVYPATSAFIAHQQALSSLTQNYSLMAVDRARLEELDLAAHHDPIYKAYIESLRARLPDIAAAPNVKKYSQFCEIYSEALVLQFLRTKVETWRVDETNDQTPDFRCRLRNGKQFYVEVKTLDIVGGEYRHDEMMVDAIDQAVELKEQIAEGCTVAVAEGEFAPYKRFQETETYDPRSLARVIDTLREKFAQTFKAGQFGVGPTLALAVTDRLSFPGGHCALTPYYLDRAPSPCIVSGVLWHAAFGTPGNPVLRAPDFEGAPSLEGYVTAPGIFMDKGRPFPGLALIVLCRGRRGAEDEALGLHPVRADKTGAWTNDDTAEALSAICAFQNDPLNTRAANLSEYPSGEARV